MASTSINRIIQSLVTLDNNLTSLDLDYALRQQYIHTVQLFLTTPEGIQLQDYVDQCALSTTVGIHARQTLNTLINRIPSLNAKDHHHHHGHDINALPEATKPHIGIIAIPDGRKRASFALETTDALNDIGIQSDQNQIIDDEVELSLMEHMSIEEKQLRPVCVALSCAVLFQSWTSNPRYLHLLRSVPQALMKCLFTFKRQDLGIYTTSDASEYRNAADVEKKEEENEQKTRKIAADTDYSQLNQRKAPPAPPSLMDLLSSIPFSTIVRTLEPQVEKLVKQRKLMEEAQIHAMARRQARKRAILRTAAKWQNNSRHSYFIHWSNICKTLKKQRQKLVSKFIVMKTPTLKQIFDEWHVVAISDRLERCAEERDEIKYKLNDLKEQLEEAKVTESDLFQNLNEQIKRREMLTVKIEATKEAIDAQRVPGTKEVLFATSQSFIEYCEIILNDAQKFLVWATKAPSVEKIARMYWVDREALRMKEREKETQAALDKLREEENIKEEKKNARIAKKQASDRAKTEKRASNAAKEAFDLAEEEFVQKFDAAKSEHEENIRKLKKENAALLQEGEEDTTNYPPFSPSEHNLTMEIRKKASDKAASKASKAVFSQERERLAVLEEKKKANAAKAKALNDIVVAEKEKKFKAQQERRDNRISEEDIQAAMVGMCTVPQDRLLLRWIKYHLRRSTRHGFPYRRNFMNFKNDIRDGVSYAVLMNKIAPETILPYFSTTTNKMEPNLDSEIDPQLRIDTMLEYCGRLDPPAVGFITRGHILGFEPFLNAAFVTRLFLTTHGFCIGENHPAVSAAQDIFNDLFERWNKIKETASQLTTWGSWELMRQKYNDGKLIQMLEDMQRYCNELSEFVGSLTPIRTRANRGYQEWEPIYDYMNQFLYKMYSVKMNQEEEAPMGTIPDVDQGHCPFQLVDYRHEIKFLKYTQMIRERIREIILMEATHHLRRIAIAHRETEIESGQEDKELSFEELQLINAVEMPLDEIQIQIDEMEQILRDEYAELKLIFDYYAAGGEGGSAFDMSIAEFTRYATESKIVEKNKWCSKDDIKPIFDHAAGVEEEDEMADIGEADISDTEAEEAAEAAKQAAANGTDGTDETKAVELDDEGNPIVPPELDEDGNVIVKLDEDGNPIDPEEEEEEEYSWTLAEGEKEIVPKQWSETIIHFALRRYPNIHPLSRRLKKLIVDVIKPNACQSNTDTFRGELSMDEVQKIYKIYKPQLLAIFMYYAEEHPAKPGQPPMEPSMDGPKWLQMMKDSKLVTRKSDVPNDLPELSAREIFNNVQMEEEEDGGGDVGGGADEMIYMEYLEAWGAVACFKKVNPYVPLWKRMEETFTEKLFPAQKRFALAPPKKKKKGK